MQIDSTGFIKATLTNYLEYFTADMQATGVFGEDYTIKKEGVIDNILATVSNAFISLEDKFAFALKQINPYTAEGVYQDNLYALIGLKRKIGTYTIVSRTISGTANTVIGVNELVFKTAQDDQFYLNTSVTLDTNGKAVGSFTAYESGSIPCDINSNLVIVEKPESGVDTVYYESGGGNVTDVGMDFESDSEFRTRWLNTQSVPASSNTVSGLRTALLELVENNPKNLKIRQNRNNLVYSDMPLATLNVILKSAYSDNDIARTIFNHVTDGVGLYGSTTVTLKDSEDTDVDIKFTRASELQILFNVEVVLNSGYSLDTDKIKSAIIDNFSYGMGEKVIANDFYQYINALESVDYVDTLEIKISGGSYTDKIIPDYNEYATVIASNITVSEVE